MTAVEHERHLVASFDEGLPADAGKVEGNLGGEQGPRRVLIVLNILKRREERLIMRGGAEPREVGEPEEGRTIGAKEAPHQRAVIVVVIGGDLLIVRAQCRGSAMRGQDLPDALPQRWIILGGLHRLIENLGKDRQHLLFEFPMSVLEGAQMLVGGGGHALHAFEEHLHHLVAGLDLGLREETEEEAPAPRRLDVAHVPDCEGVRLCSKLPDLVCAIPASNGWGARTASSQVKRSSHSRRCMRVAWRGDAFIRANSDGPLSTWRRASSRACGAGLSELVSWVYNV